MKIKFFLIFKFLCVLSLIKAEASIGDSLFKVGKYNEASIAYEYLIYSSNNIYVSNVAKYHKALCYKQMGLFKKASVEMEKINYSALSDSQFLIFHYEAALNAYLSEDFNTSVFHTDQALLRNHKWHICNELYLVRALSYNNLEKWDKAHDAAIHYCNVAFENELKENIKAKIDSIYEIKNIPKIKSEKKLSYYCLIPGFGQVYCGYYFEGLLNFSLNALALAAGGYEIYYRYFITGYCLAAVPINKFYFGGKRRAEFSIKKTNYLRLNGFNEKVKNLLINENKKGAD